VALLVARAVGGSASTGTADSGAMASPAATDASAAATGTTPAEPAPEEAHEAHGSHDSHDPLAPVIAEADAALRKKDPAAVIAAIAPLEAANASRPDVHRLLERAYAMSQDRAAALREADTWLALDPSAVSDLKLQADVGEAATHLETSEAAIALLASRLGAPGVDILYDLAYGGSAPWTPRALAALERADVRAHAGPAAALLLELRAAKDCPDWRRLVPRVKTEGDRRAAVVLRTRAPAHCLKKGELKEAIAAANAHGSML
jgi:hypothetical protein